MILFLQASMDKASIRAFTGQTGPGSFHGNGYSSSTRTGSGPEIVAGRHTISLSAKILLKCKTIWKLSSRLR